MPFKEREDYNRYKREYYKRQKVEREAEIVTYQNRIRSLEEQLRLMKEGKQK